MLEVGKLAQAREAEIHQKRHDERSLDGFSAFVVRVDKGYTWELRRYGGLRIAKGGDQIYTKVGDALAAGQIALNRHRAAKQDGARGPVR